MMNTFPVQDGNLPQSRQRGRPRSSLTQDGVVIRWSVEERNNLWHMKNQDEHKHLSWEEFHQLKSEQFPGRTWRALSMAYGRVETKLSRAGSGYPSKRPSSTSIGSSGARQCKRPKHEDDDDDDYEDSSSGDEERTSDENGEARVQTGTLPDRPQQAALVQEIPAPSIRGGSHIPPVLQQPSEHRYHHLPAAFVPPTPPRQADSITPVQNGTTQAVAGARQPSEPGSVALPGSVAVPDQRVQALIQWADSLAQQKDLMEAKVEQEAETMFLRHELERVQQELKRMSENERKYSELEKRVEEISVSRKGEQEAAIASSKQVLDRLEESERRCKELEGKVEGMKSSRDQEAMKLVEMKMQMGEVQRRLAIFDGLRSLSALDMLQKLSDLK
ncbi:hypothetical protein BDW59DRAFT_150125 [Aspergillus cavernicola]|uniref:Myb-like domain-containing protein n=1 Tax=Aspergillus cavernicola TaxID=176166 RepID=A0ABR4I139_9EURO